VKSPAKARGAVEPSASGRVEPLYDPHCIKTAVEVESRATVAADGTADIAWPVNRSVIVATCDINDGADPCAVEPGVPSSNVQWAIVPALADVIPAATARTANT
jgi:hypothetical protein